jgi:hypothetical protein
MMWPGVAWLGVSRRWRGGRCICRRACRAAAVAWWCALACGADVAALGAYRSLYLVNWIFRYFTEDDYVQRIVWVAGVVQTGLYCDFFYHYYQSKRGGMNRPVKLPV